MPHQNLTEEFEKNCRRTRRAALILAGVAALVWGAAAVLTSEDTTTATDESVPPTTAVEQTPPGTDSAESPAVSPTEPVGPTDPPPPQVPVGGNGDLAPTPTTEPPTCDGSCVAPVDLHPFEIEIARTPVGIGFASADEGGCSTECITRAQIFQTDDTTDVAIEVETHTPAFIAIYIDDEEPHVTNDGRPYFPGAQPAVNSHGDLDTWFSDTLTDLNESTEYWVIVRATDENVRSSYVVGSLVTPYLGNDVVIAFAAIDIVYDGDHGKNKGELTFSWFAGADEVGSNGEYERGDGSRIDLSNQNNVAGVFNLNDEVILQVRGLERDPGNGRYCSAGDDQMGYGTDDNCGYAWNSTVPFAPTMDDLAAMADCSVFDLDDDLYGGWVCTRIATVESHSGLPEFSVVVAFKVA